MAKILSVNSSRSLNSRRRPAEKLLLKVGVGIVGDGYAGDWHRQICLLTQEGIDRCLSPKRKRPRYGCFFENIDSEGIELKELAVGSLLRIGTAVIEITQIGEPETFSEGDPCAATESFNFAMYVLEREAVFAEVVKDGTVKPDDEIEVVEGGILYGYQNHKCSA